MLNVMRQNLKSLKWVLWVVAIAMTLYLGKFFLDSGRRDAGNWVARVNGAEIGRREFLSTARSIDANYRRILGENYEQFRQSLQIGTQAVRQLVQRKLILADARRLGLSAGEAELQDRILSDPSFKDPNGAFIGVERYEILVNNQIPGGISAYEKSLRDELLINKWTDMIGASLTVGESELERIFRKRTVKTAINYVVVPAEDRAADPEPTEEELSAWYDAHREDYRRGEGRRIRYAVVDTDAQRARVIVTDDDIRRYYDANASDYQKPAGRSARHILLKIEAGATDEQKQQLRGQVEAILTRLDNGEDFATLAQALSEDTLSAQNGGDLGFFGPGDMVPEFDQAAFSTPVGQRVPSVIETQFGFHVIEVTGERPAGATPLSEVEGQIRSLLVARRTGDRVRSESERLREEMGTAEGFETVAAREGLEIDSLTITAGETLTSIGAGADLAAAVFATDPGELAPLVRIGNGMALIAVDGEVPSEIPPLSEVRDVVVEDTRAERAVAAALERAERAVAEHGEIDAIATAMQLDLRESGDLAPGQPVPYAGGESDELQYRLFDADPRLGDRGIVAAPAGALVYEISARQPFDPARFASEREELRKQLLSQRQERLFQAMVEKISEDQQVEINDQVVQRYNG